MLKISSLLASDVLTMVFDPGLQIKIGGIEQHRLAQVNETV